MGDAILMDFGAPVTFNAIVTKEDLSKGQRIAAYVVDFFDDAVAAWKSFDVIADPYPFSLPVEQCGVEQSGVNLVSGAPAGTHVVGLTDDAPACGELCQADPKCNFW